EFTGNNYGKTPGILLEYAVEFCPLDAIPPVPNYQRVQYHDRIAPGGYHETQRLTYLQIPQLERPLFVFGRFWYEDIWNHKHTSGFVLVLTDQGTTPRVPSDIPKAYTYWD